MSIDPHTKLCALLGDPVAHSGSPAMHNAAFKATGRNIKYLAFQVPSLQLPKAIRGLAALGAVGANVTVPHKEQALLLADDATERAHRIGAANVLTFRDGQVLADNTDGIGFIASVQQAGGTVAGRTVMVIGAGGAARAVIVACLEAGAQRLVLLNRSLDRAIQLVDLYRKLFPGDDRLEAMPLTKGPSVLPFTDLIINATSLGLRPEDPSPLADLDRAPDHALAVDLIYARHTTAFMAAAAAAGLRAIDGRGMLVWQAAYSWEVWFGERGPVDVMATALASWLARNTA